MTQKPNTAKLANSYKKNPITFQQCGYSSGTRHNPTAGATATTNQQQQKTFDYEKRLTGKFSGGFCLVG